MQAEEDGHGPHFGLAGYDDSPALVIRLYSALWRRKLLLAATVLACLLLGFVVTLLMTPRYTAVSTIEISRDVGSNLVNIQGQAQQSIDTEFYETQYGLLRSQTLANRVAQRLNLYNDPAFFNTFGVKTEEWFANGRAKAGAPSRDDRIKFAGNLLLGGLKIDPKRLSRLISISFTAPNAVLAKRVVDAWAASFVQLTLERRYEASSYARTFLEQRLSQLRSRIDSSERQLVTYAAQQGIVNVPGGVTSTGGENGTTSTSERPLVADDLAILNRELAQATADRIVAESRLSASGGQVTEALTNPTLSSLRQRRAELSAEYARLMVQFEPSYPPARALQDQIAQLSRSLRIEEGGITNILKQTYGAAQMREAALQRRVNQLKVSVLDLRRRNIEYDIIQRDVDTNRQLYDALLQKYKETGIAGGVGVNNIAVVDQAELPTAPSSPRLAINLAISLVLGLMIGGAAVLILEQLNQGIADPHMLDEALGIPLLGVIPRSGEANLREALADRKSVTSEAYTSLQTTLGFSTDHGIPRVLAVTSTRAGEGKSTTAYALAIAIARSQRRVMLVDGDLRSPSVHSEFDIANQSGLSNYLSGAASLDDVIRATSYENLTIITAGPQPPSAPELLAGARFGQLITELSERFDHIVFDAPPVMSLADAPMICSQVDGVIMIVESHSTHKNAARSALGRLFTANAPVIGAVLTKFNAKKSSRSYGYGYGYDYQYGDART